MIIIDHDNNDHDNDDINNDNSIIKHYLVYQLDQVVLIELIVYDSHSSFNGVVIVIYHDTSSYTTTCLSHIFSWYHMEIS